VKKLRKSVNICQSYRKNKSGTFFMDHGVVILLELCLLPILWYFLLQPGKNMEW